MPDVTGPFGGIIASVYALGCVSGWGFNMLLMSSRIAEIRRDCAERDVEHRREITELKAEVSKLHDFLMRGAERQRDQLHDSTVRMIDRGRITPPLGEAE